MKILAGVCQVMDMATGERRAALLGGFGRTKLLKEIAAGFSLRRHRLKTCATRVFPNRMIASQHEGDLPSGDRWRAEPTLGKIIKNKKLLEENRPSATRSSNYATGPSYLNPPLQKGDLVCHNDILHRFKNFLP